MDSFGIFGNKEQVEQYLGTELILENFLLLSPLELRVSLRPGQVSGQSIERDVDNNFIFIIESAYSFQVINKKIKGTRHHLYFHYPELLLVHIFMYVARYFSVNAAECSFLPLLF